MKLIVITATDTLHKETDTVNKLFEQGLQRLHIRKPQFTADELQQYIDAIERQYHKHLVLHNHFELYHSSLGGIHLNSHARNTPDIWQQLKNIPEADLSTSFHSWQEVMDNQYPYGYVFISPVFNSISKPGYEASIDLKEAKNTKEELARHKQHIPLIIGLGGVNADNLVTLYHNSFDGAAMLGNIWQAGDPVAEFKKANETIRLIEDGLYHSAG